LEKKMLIRYLLEDYLKDHPELKVKLGQLDPVPTPEPTVPVRIDGGAVSCDNPLKNKAGRPDWKATAESIQAQLTSVGQNAAALLNAYGARQEAWSSLHYIIQWENAQYHRTLQEALELMEKEGLIPPLDNAQYRRNLKETLELIEKEKFIPPSKAPPPPTYIPKTPERRSMIQRVKDLLK